MTYAPPSGNPKRRRRSSPRFGPTASPAGVSTRPNRRLLVRGRRVWQMEVVGDVAHTRDFARRRLQLLNLLLPVELTAEDHDAVLDVDVHATLRHLVIAEDDALDA